MSGHSVDLTPSGAYFDGQGYYFDGVDDYLIDDNGQKILQEDTKGSWHSIYLTENEVPPEGSIRGTGTEIRLHTTDTEPKITGKIILYPEWCPNLVKIQAYRNAISFVGISGLPSLEHLDFAYNNVSTFNISNLPSIGRIYCQNNSICTISLRALTSLYFLRCRENNLSFLDVSTGTGLSRLECHNNSMDQDMVDTVLCDMDSHGTSNGYLNISGNAAPSATGVACKNNLVARGWTVYTS